MHKCQLIFKLVFMKNNYYPSNYKMFYEVNDTVLRLEALKKPNKHLCVQKCVIYLVKMTYLVWKWSLIFKSICDGQTDCDARWAKSKARFIKQARSTTQQQQGTSGHNQEGKDWVRVTRRAEVRTRQNNQTSNSIQRGKTKSKPESQKGVKPGNQRE